MRSCARAGITALAALALLALTRAIKIGDVNIDPDADDEDYDDWKKDWAPKGKASTAKGEKKGAMGGAPGGMPGMGGMMGGGGGGEGPKLVFARLRHDASGMRTQQDVEAVATRWSSMLRNGGLAENLFAIDADTILISVSASKDIEEVKEFVLQSDEGYEFEIDNQKFRRDGDPPLPEKPPAAAAPKDKKDKKKKKKKKERKSAKTSSRTLDAQGGKDEL